MSYLRNAWYAAGWSHDVGSTPLARTFHDIPVVFYRGQDGSVIALHDMCPHRFAPLSLGRVQGDIIACGYHGLEFSSTGACVRNPHGRGATPTSLSVRAFPVAERGRMLWIWMGDAERADTALVPSFEALGDDRLSWVHGQLHVNANYQLVIDNLLDLTHVEFLHPFLASSGNSERTTFRTTQVENGVSAFYDIKDEPVSGLFQMLWGGDETHGDMRAYMHWTAPANLYLDVGMAPSGSDIARGAAIPTVHLLTPETEDTTHYFWAAGRNRRHGDEEISRMLRYGTQNAFENEDEPMIRAVRSRMRSNDLFAHKPALLPTDEAAVRARRTIERMIEAEAAPGQAA